MSLKDYKRTYKYHKRPYHYVKADLGHLEFIYDKLENQIKGSSSGENGVSIEWLGDFITAPINPSLNQAYYNTTDGASYVWDGTVWNVVAKDGIDGSSDGFKGTIEISDTPVDDGIYRPIEEGTYTNAGGLEYLPSTTDEGYQVDFILSGGVWSKSKVNVNNSKKTLADLDTTKDLALGKISTGEYLGSNGLVVTGSSGVITDFINIENYGKINVIANSSNVRYCFFYDSSQNPIGNGYQSDMSQETVLQVPYNAKYFRASARTDTPEIVVKVDYPEWYELAEKKEIPDTNELGIEENDVVYSVQDVYLDLVDGSDAISTNHLATPYINIFKNTLKYKGFIGNTSGESVCFYDVNNNFISSFQSLTTKTEFTDIPIPPNAVKFRASRQKVNNSLELKVVGKIINDIDSIPDIPNIDEYGISERELDFTILNHYYNKSTGVLTSNNNFDSTELIPVFFDFLEYKGELGTISGENVCFFDQNKDFISSFQEPTEMTEFTKIDLPQGTSFIGVCRKEANTNLVVRLVGKILDDYLQSNTDYSDKFVELDSERYFTFGEHSEKIMETVSSDPNDFGLLLMGQSNAGPRALYSELPSEGLPNTLPAAKFDGNTFNSPMNLTSPDKWGVEWPLINSLINYRGHSVNFHLNYQGATSITDTWNPEEALKSGNNKLSDFVRDMPKMLSDLPTLKFNAVVWIQGEYDRVEPNASEYYFRLKNLISFIRGINNNPYLPWVIVGQHPDQAQFSEKVRDQQQKVAEETNDCYFINPASLTYGDYGSGNHYNSAYTVLVANEVFEIIKDF